MADSTKFETLIKCHRSSSISGNVDLIVSDHRPSDPGGGRSLITQYLTKFGIPIVFAEEMEPFSEAHPGFALARPGGE